MLRIGEKENAYRDVGVKSERKRRHGKTYVQLGNH